jgi:ferrochelatase
MNMLQQPDQGTAMKPESTLAHAPSDHPKVTFGKVGILLANLGTPDQLRLLVDAALPERISVRQAGYRLFRLWIWQPLLQLVILSKRPFSSGAAYKSIWNEEAGESPLMTITKDQTAKIKSTDGKAFTATRSSSISACATAIHRPSRRCDEMVAQGCRRSCFFRCTRTMPGPRRPPLERSSSFAH